MERLSGPREREGGEHFLGFEILLFSLTVQSTEKLDQAYQRAVAQQRS